MESPTDEQDALWNAAWHAMSGLPALKVLDLMMAWLTDNPMYAGPLIRQINDELAP